MTKEERDFESVSLDRLRSLISRFYRHDRGCNRKSEEHQMLDRASNEKESSISGADVSNGNVNPEDLKQIICMSLIV